MHPSPTPYHLPRRVYRWGGLTYEKPGRGGLTYEKHGYTHSNTHTVTHTPARGGVSDFLPPPSCVKLLGGSPMGKDLLEARQASSSDENHGDTPRT